MPSNPKAVGRQFETASMAWEEHAADAVFGKLTLAQYKSKLKPSLEARAVIQDLEEKLAAARVERDNADVVSNAVTLDVVNSIKGDPSFGENSALYAALGYVRKDDRASGLKRNVVYAVKQGPNRSFDSALLVFYHWCKGPIKYTEKRARRGRAAWWRCSPSRWCAWGEVLRLKVKAQKKLNHQSTAAALARQGLMES